MKNKIGIITGFTSGIGLATATSLAAMGATLGLVCRNKSKGEKTIQLIKDKTGNNNIKLFIADLSSLADIYNIADEIKNNFPVIDVLVNNAGVVNKNKILTVDGYEATFALNHLAYFLLTKLLLDSLKASPKARIVSVASEAAMGGKINFDDLHFKKKYSFWRAYANSKLANIIFTYELAKRLKGTNVTANCIYPGIVRTNFGRELTGFWGIIFTKLNGLLRNAEKGAETIIWLVTSPEAEGITGKYFKDKKEIKSNKCSYNVDLQQKLWNVSEELVKLKNN
ncbi:MAG: SDR family oxidoreductase [Bacteroidetes bacterium]|nr:SDR family oxidoreductase [Bacteroidota bacterium]